MSICFSLVCRLLGLPLINQALYRDLSDRKLCTVPSLDLGLFNLFKAETLSTCYHTNLGVGLDGALNLEFILLSYFS